MAENGNIDCDLMYSGFSLGNSEDEVVLRDSGGNLIDEVLYNIGVDPWDGLGTAGYSMQLDSSSYNASDNDNGANWCEVENVIDATCGDSGTPGTANYSCL
jgi:hypothetical protein